jgi:predicted transcriptional regulator
MKHVYSAVLQEEKTKKAMLGRFVESIYNGSPSSLMLALLDDNTSKDELQKIKELLNQMDNKQ